jgi:hypothetical protein
MGNTFQLLLELGWAEFTSIAFNLGGLSFIFILHFSYYLNFAFYF